MEFLLAQMYVIVIVIICSLLVTVDCVADKYWNLVKSYIFLIQGQTHSFVFNLVPGTLEIAF